MQSGIQRTRSIFSALAGLTLAGLLSACGGGGGEQHNATPPAKDPVVPPVTSTNFERLGLDVQLFSNTPSDSTGYLFGSSIDASANITFANSDKQLADQPAFNYSFTFPSGLPGGSIQGNLYTFVSGSANKEIKLLTPGATQFVQNVFWRGKDDPSLFGIGQAGYLLKPTAQHWPTNGTATYSGKAFQYIVDSNAAVPAESTYALYISEVTATVDYSAKSLAITVAPNPIFNHSIGEPAVLNADPAQFAANYALTNLDLSGENSYQVITETQPMSGFGLTATENALAFFGNNAEELGGFVRYKGEVTTASGQMIRNQFISFALAKQ